MVYFCGRLSVRFRLDPSPFIVKGGSEIGSPADGSRLLTTATTYDELSETADYSGCVMYTSIVEIAVII